MSTTMIPAEWLEPGAVLPVTAETVATLLAAVKASTFTQGRAAGLEEERAIPEEVKKALDRICKPLHDSVLSGATAAADAYCMEVIRNYVMSTASPTSSDAGKDDARDTARLDFIIDRCAFVHLTKTDAGTIAYQVMQQDEDEDYHILSGEDRFFPTYRAAIDAAMSSLEVIGKGEKE